MKLILTRHGETEENVKGISQGHMPGKLTKAGIEQAEKLALRLKDERIDAIFSSDLARAADTAKIVAKYHPDTPLKYVQKLREYDLGAFTGKHKSEIDWSKRPDDAEPEVAGVKRILDFIDRVYQEYKDKTVLFVSHGGVTFFLISHIEGKRPDRIGNTAVNLIEVKEDRNHKIHLLNCTEHLE